LGEKVTLLESLSEAGSYVDLPSSAAAADRGLTDSKGTPPLPIWFEGLIRDSIHLLSYGENWDSYGSSPVSPQAFQSAFLLIALLAWEHGRLPAPAVVPTSLGGIALEWVTDRGSVEVEVNAPNRGELYYRFPETGEDAEEEFRSLAAPLHYLKRLFAPA
jgi:hypothetical protein